MSVTQKQIAEHLGVSQSLVTQSLRDLPRIPEATRLRVKEAARELGYIAHSNDAARTLRARRDGTRPLTQTIGVLMGDFFEGLPLHEVPFYQPLLQGLKAEAARRDVDLSFFTCQIHRLPRFFVQGGVDGVIGLYNGPIDPELKKQLSCALLRIGDGAPDEWALRPDDRRGIYLATRHLIELGHRHIAYLGDSRGNETRDLMYKSRLDGYFQALGDCGLPVSNDLVEAHIGAPDHQAGAMGVGRLLDRTREFTALVCFNDSSALGAIAELQRRGLAVPGDVSVTGFDDVSGEGRHDPALTTVHFDRFEMGRRAVEAICEVAEEGTESEFRGHELMPVRLIERASSGPKRVV